MLCTYLLIHKTQVYLFCRSARRLSVFSRMIFLVLALLLQQQQLLSIVSKSTRFYCPHITIATTNLWFNIKMLLTQSKSILCCRRVYSAHPKFIPIMKSTIWVETLCRLTNRIELNGIELLVSIMKVLLGA